MHDIATATSTSIVGSNTAECVAAPAADLSGVFRRHGWTGDGDRMLRPRCPTCSGVTAGLGLEKRERFQEAHVITTAVAGETFVRRDFAGFVPQSSSERNDE